MWSSDDKWTKPALALIAQYDAGTYQRMQSAKWYVHVVKYGSDLAQVYQDDGPMWALQLADAVSHAFGVTISGEVRENPRDLFRTTWLNRPMIEDTAKNKLHTPVSHFLADVLVHEFAHREGAVNEAPAFDKGTEFAEKMGDEKVAGLSRATKGPEVKHQEYLSGL